MAIIMTLWIVNGSTTTTILYFTQKVHKVQLEDMKVNAWMKRERKKKDEYLIRLTREEYSGGEREEGRQIQVFT